MGQVEILKLLEKKPRLFIKEIVNELEGSYWSVSRALYKLLRIKEVKNICPTSEELKRISKKFPNTIHYGKDIKVFMVEKND